MEFEGEVEELCLDCLNDTGRPDTALLQASTNSRKGQMVGTEVNINRHAYSSKKIGLFSK